MKTYNDCIPCLVRQALGAARFISNDEEVHQKVLKKTLVALAAMDMNQSPPMMARHIQNTITEVTFVVRGGGAALNDATLEDDRIFFLFKAKCPVVAGSAGVNLNEMVLNAFVICVCFRVALLVKIKIICG